MEISYTLFDTFELKGYWYKENTDEKIAGILHYTPTEISLELFGTFSKDFAIRDKEKMNIYGITEDNFQMSLFNCSELNRRSFDDKFTTYQVTSFTMGECLIANMDEAVFIKMNFSMQYFDKWLTYPIYDANFNHLHNPDEWLINERKMKSNLQSSYIGSESINIKESYEYSISQAISSIPDVKFKRFMSVESYKRNSLSYFESIKRYLSNFYSLLMGEYTATKYIELFTGEKELFFKNDKKIIISRKVRFYYTTLKGKSSKNRSHFLFDYDQVKADMPKLLNIWFDEQDRIRPMLNLYFSILENSSVLEFKFLNNIRILEIYSRDFMKSREELLDKKLINAQEELLDFLEERYGDDAEIKKYFELRILYREETSLNKRIKSILNFLPQSIIDSMIQLPGRCPSDSKSRFSASICDTRNYYTHGDSRRKKYRNLIEDPHELLIVIEKTNLIIEYIFLAKILELDKKLVSEALLNDSQYSY